MNTIRELRKKGFNEVFVSEEESGDKPFMYLTFKTRHEVELISDDYHPNTDSDVKIKVFFIEGNQEEVSDDLLEQLV